MQCYSLRICTFLILLFGMLTSNYGQNKEEKKKEEVKIKKYEEVVTEKTRTQEGLFKVHQNGGKFLYEIPYDLFNKDMLLVSRISKIAEGLGGGYMNAGTKTNEQIIQWSKVHNKIHLKSISYKNVADENLPISISVENNNHHPILAAFKIAAYNQDSTAILIEVNNLFLNDVSSLSGLSNKMRENYKVKGLDKNRSFIKYVASYPENIEVRHDMTYNATKPPSNIKSGTISLEMSQSMFLLPEETMQARLFDQRVGWFTLSQNDYGSEALKADKKTYIKRWKMIPKDIEAYNRGELVEPEKPIVYYIDPATPSKWVPYFKQGILDWIVAFERAGFKNAIQVREAPSKFEDPSWTPEDARYSTVRYVASTTRNAMGPSVVDPRSGEIIESDIIWYHNHLRSYRNRYLLETGAANPSARTLNTPEEEIGEMMRRVISHEVGHALGLPHNMKSSYAYPTDSLRSASFTQKWGLATTIMDYTRYNYVAQPGDEGVRWVRMLGPYDIYSINWGYRYISDANSPEEEEKILDSWIDEKKGDPKYLFGARNSYDPSSQTECVGDDPVLASSYGLSNLKIVAPNLAKWTATEGEGFADLEELYGELISVWSRFSNHVSANIGGVYEKLITTDEPGQTFTHLSKEEQIRSMKFLNENVFTTPTWLLQKDIINNISPSGSVDRIYKMQSRSMRSLLNKARLSRMIDNEAINGSRAYTLTNMLSDLRNGVWSELDGNKLIDPYRRNVQRAHIQALSKLIKSDFNEWSDVSAAARNELELIKAKAFKSSKKYNKGRISRSHLKDVVAMVGAILNQEIKTSQK